MKAKVKRLLELIEELIKELKKEVIQDQNSLSQDRPYIRHKTSVLEQIVMNRDESYEERCKAIDELKLRDIANPNTRN